MFRAGRSSVSRERCVQTQALDAVEFARKRLGFEPDAGQCEVLRSTAKRGILNCTRQWGKSTVSAAKAVHRAYTQNGITVLVASPGARQSGEWMKKAAAMLARLDIPKKTDGANRISLALPNGSRIVGLPDVEAKVRGFSAPAMVLIDEASRVSDELYTALLPMLAVSDGELWMMSTPFGKRGFFYETWEHGGEDWHRIRVQATDCARIPAAFLEKQRREMGLQKFAEDHMCEFLGGGTNAFDRDLVEAALDADIPLWNAEARSTPAWLSSRAGQMFYIGVDLGKKQDHSALAMVETDDGQMMVRHVERIALGTPYLRVVEMVRELVRSPGLAGRCAVVVDGSGVGEPVMEMFRRAELGCSLAAVNITGGSAARTGRSGGYTNVPKFDLMTGLQLALENGQLKIARRMKEAGSLVKELLDVRVTENGGMSAEGAGRHDDLVMAVALGCWRAKRGFNDRGGGGFL
jgi:hypothetical protein